MNADYQANQARIYAHDFRATMQALTSVKAAPCVLEPTAGYIVAWQYPDEVMSAVEMMNGRVHDIVPTIRFDKNNAHTTITVYQKQPLTAEPFQAEEQTLRALADACHCLDAQLLRDVQVDFQEWLFNEEAVIAAGQANVAFWQVGEALQAAGKIYGLNLRMPWGAHMTIARFLASSTRVSDLLTLTSQMPQLGLCQPHAVIVGHYVCGPSAFHLYPFAKREV